MSHTATLAVRDPARYHNGIQYTLERYPHGWLIRGSVPVTEFAKQITKLLSKKAVMNGAVAGHYQANAALAEPKEMDAWIAEIEDSVKDFNPESRFLGGTHTGKSALTIFAALTVIPCNKSRAEHYYPGTFDPAVPYDAGDFGRCQYLLSLIPAWKARLAEVGVAYPKTAWSKLAAEWATLESLSPEKLSARLQELANSI